MPVLRPLVLSVSAVFVFSLVSRVGAEAPAWKKPLTDMFNAGWRSGTEAQLAAEQHYHAAEKLAGNDARLEYAWALVLIKQKRNDAALEQLDRILKLNPENLTVLMWKIRLRLYSKKYPEAIVDMEQLAGAAAAVLEKGKEPAQRAEGLAAARFLGRSLGFLEGPADMKASQREELKAALVQQLPTDGQQAFAAARTDVLDQFSAFQRQGEQHRAEDQDKEVQDKKNLQEQVDAQRVNLERELADIGTERTKIQGDQRRELADVSRDARQADSVVSQAEARLAAVLRQWNILQAEHFRWQTSMDAERDPVRREIFRNELTRIDISLGTIDADRRLRENDVLRARAQRGEVERSRMEVQRRYQGTLASLDKREDAARRGQHRLGSDQKKIDKPVSGQSSRQRNLNARATVYATYDDLSLDMERARLLAALK